MDDSFIKGLLASIKCGICDQHYEVGSVDVLGHHEDLWFLRAVCPTCHTQCLMAAVVEEGRVPEVITDLTETELDKFKNVSEPTADEMLDMCNFLKDFNGDFSQLFSQK